MKFTCLNCLKVLIPEAAYLACKVCYTSYLCVHCCIEITQTGINGEKKLKEYEMKHERELHKSVNLVE